MNDLVTVILQKTETETGGAIMFFDEDEVPIWIPRSQIRSLSYDPNGFCEVTIPDWLADEKNLQPLDRSL